MRPARRASLSRACVVAAAGATTMLAASDVARAQATVESAAASHALHIVGAAVQPDERLIAARKGDRLRLRVVSDRAGELHLHAYRLSVAVVAGRPAELAFTAYATGRFRLEWHPADGHGTAGDTGHDAAPLATLEVRPR